MPIAWWRECSEPNIPWKKTMWWIYSILFRQGRLSINTLFSVQALLVACGQMFFYSYCSTIHDMKQNVFVPLSTGRVDLPADLQFPIMPALYIMNFLGEFAFHCISFSFHPPIWVDFPPLRQSISEDYPHTVYGVKRGEAFKSIACQVKYFYGKHMILSEHDSVYNKR